VAIRPGTVFLAPDGYHLVAAAAGRLELSDAAPDGGHRPSVDRLLNSLAQLAVRNPIGVILSGMGSDGAKGIAQLRAQGALAIAQDEASSAVWGMPRAAAEVSGVWVLPLAEIAPALIRATSKGPRW
jgi:two-component system chemotaxis response regulator CheB